jgi:hypothetical protein
VKKKLRQKLLISLATIALLSSLVAPALQSLKAQAVVVDSPSDHPQQDVLKKIVDKIENFASKASNLTINPAVGYPVENPTNNTHAVVTPEDIKFVTDVTKQQLNGQSVVREIIAPHQGVVFSGDWHGNLQDLVKFTQDVMNSGKLLVFTGDNVDRGLYSVEVATLLLAMQNLYPDRIVYVRGDHEDSGVNNLYGLSAECKAKYGALPPSECIPEDLDRNNEHLKEVDRQVWERLNGAFNFLPFAAVIFNVDCTKKSLAVHGGVSPEMNLNSLKQISVPRTRPSEFPEEEDEDEYAQRLEEWTSLHQLLWNDQDWINATGRRTEHSHVCSEEDTDNFCDANEVADIFSGHYHVRGASGFREFGSDKHKCYVNTSSKYNDVGKLLTGNNNDYSRIRPYDNNSIQIQKRASLTKAAVTFADGNLENVKGVDLEKVAEFIAEDEYEMENFIVIPLKERHPSPRERREGWNYPIPAKLALGDTPLVKYQGPYYGYGDKDVLRFLALQDIKIDNDEVIDKGSAIFVCKANPITKMLRIEWTRSLRPKKIYGYDDHFGSHLGQEVYSAEVSLSALGIS